MLRNLALSLGRWPGCWRWRSWQLACLLSWQQTDLSHRVTRKNKTQPRLHDVVWKKYSLSGEHRWDFKRQRKKIKTGGRRCFCWRNLHNSSDLIALIGVWLQSDQKDRDKWTSCRKDDPHWSCLVGRDTESTKVKSLMTSILNDCSSCIPSG